MSRGAGPCREERAAFLTTACAGDDACSARSSRCSRRKPSRRIHERPASAVARIGRFRTGEGLTRRPTPRSYTIRSLLGVGGMGEVYRAHDDTLGREVAIKVLPPAFTADPERRARFEREARMLATLNHPHIGAIYGVEEADGVRGLVLELVEGETLAERIAQTSRLRAGGCPTAIASAARSRGRSPTRSTPRTKRASSIAI